MRLLFCFYLAYKVFAFQKHKVKLRLSQIIDNQEAVDENSVYV